MASHDDFDFLYEPTWVLRNGQAERFCASRRDDPVFSRLIPEVASRPHYTSYSALEALVANHHVSVPRKIMRPTPQRAKQAWGWITHPQTKWVALDAAAVVANWYNVTCAQVGAFSGRTRTVTALFNLWAAGLIEVCATPFGGGVSAGVSDYFFRPVASGLWGRDFARVFPQAALWWAFPAGPPRGVSTGVRHDIVTAELALRLAQHPQVSAIAPERVCTMDNLFGQGLGNLELPAALAPHATADAAFITTSGVRVVLDTIAGQASKRDFDKMVRYARLMSRVGVRTHPTYVVFVSIPDLRSGRTKHASRSSLLKQITRFNTHHGDEAGAKHIFHLDYSDWFDASGPLPDFDSLTVTGPDGGSFSLLDGRPQADQTTTERIANLRACPHWLRPGRTRALLAHKMAANQGFRPSCDLESSSAISAPLAPEWPYS